MDLQTLTFFRTVATEGSLSKAAAKLNYAQSNLSTKIIQLEHELNATLFYRHKHGVSLTPKGELLLDYATELLNLADETISALKDSGAPNGSLKIGSMESTAVSALPDLLARYHKKYPDVSLQVTTGITEHMVQKVLDHTLDGAFVAGSINHPELKTELFRNEQLVVISSQVLPENAVLSELLEQPLLVFPQGCSYRKRLEQLLSRENMLPKRTIEFNSLGAIVASVSAGLGISFFPESTIGVYVAKHSISCHQISDSLVSVPTVFVYRKDGYIDSSLQEFIREVKSVHAEFNI